MTDMDGYVEAGEFVNGHGSRPAQPGTETSSESFMLRSTVTITQMRAPAATPQALHSMELLFHCERSTSVKRSIYITALTTQMRVVTVHLLFAAA